MYNTNQIVHALFVVVVIVVVKSKGDRPMSGFDRMRGFREGVAFVE